MRIFISYRREDSRLIVGRIADKLNGAFGPGTVFLDVDAMPPGVDFLAYIQQCLAQSDVVLVVSGNRWLEKNEYGYPRIADPTDVVRFEIETALRGESLVVPLYVDDSTAPNPSELPPELEALTRKNGTHIRNDPHFHADMDDLIDGLASSGAGGAGAESPNSVRRRPFSPTLRGHTDMVWDFAVSPNGAWIVSASKDKTLRIWDVATATTVATLTDHRDEVTGCAISPDGASIVSVSKDQTWRIWDVATGRSRLYDRSLDPRTSEMRSCLWSPGGRWIALVSEDQTLWIWDVATKAIRTMVSGDRMILRAFAFSPDGQRIVSAATSDVRIHEVATGSIAATLTGHSGPVFDCAVSPDGTWIVSASQDKTLRIWDVATATTVTTLSGHQDQVTGCAISPDGTWIVSASKDKTLRIWDAATGTTITEHPGHNRNERGCAVSPDGTWIVSTNADDLRIWDLERSLPTTG